VPEVNHISPDVDTGKVLDEIERAVYLAIKSCGFRKHGRILHRFVSEDISQVIHFQTGQAHLGESHLLFVNLGIRIPECVLRRFSKEKDLKKYYQEYECNIRSRLGVVEGKEEACYDLYGDPAEITADILRQVVEVVLPVFEELNSRDAILSRRRSYPQFDRINDHLILLEEAMIYGCRGEMQKARDAFRQHYHMFETGQTTQKNISAIRNHLNYLDGLAATLGIRMQ